MIGPTSTVSQIPVSLTTNSNTRPVSVRTAPENEIDQINNTPNMKKLYNAKLYGGVVGAAVPLALSAVCIAKTKNILKEAPKLKALLRVGIAAAGVYLMAPATKMAASLAKTLTIFASTRGNSKAE
ncbi:MAG TPA: hypothetical protein DDW90_09825 [Cyanobacteria bacterium UBA9971]|nr:hypothetical protein [Cyanobacteria bacterium UBA9971]